jgi:signal transduction histidine kinase/ActR/RegA family two-component response regulator
LLRELEAGAAAILLPEEAAVAETDGRLLRWVGGQPPWSDLPVLVLARPGADSAAMAKAMDLLGNVTVLERPTRVATLVSTVRTALRARQRQYQIREHLQEHSRAEEALRYADRRKDEFLAILAHELRNPLAPIRNSLHILQLSSSQDPTAGRLVNMMERQVSHMVRLVDDLMEVSRISRGKIELRRGPIDLTELVRSAVETNRPLIENSGHKLSVEIPSGPLMLDGDLVRLTQVLTNLLNNAAKYSDPGGQITITVRTEGDHVLLSVRDTGKGIPREMLPHVFEPFVQVDAGRAEGGLGIGLTLVRSLVEMHGGGVEAHSEGVGRGSEFIVRLPLAGSVAPIQIPAKGSHALGILAGQRVLVVDDNRDAADSLGMLLGLFDADVHVVYGGAEALEAYASLLPSILLVDIGMPGMDGHEVARRIRQQSNSRDVTLIALTGWGQPEDVRRSRLAGFDGHLIKPADFDVLENLLTTLQARPRAQ